MDSGALAEQASVKGTCIDDLDSGALAITEQASVKGTCIDDLDSGALAITEH